MTLHFNISTDFHPQSPTSATDNLRPYMRYLSASHLLIFLSRKLRGAFGDCMGDSFLFELVIDAAYLQVSIEQTSSISSNRFLAERNDRAWKLDRGDMEYDNILLPVYVERHIILFSTYVELYIILLSADVEYCIVLLPAAWASSSKGIAWIPTLFASNTDNILDILLGWLAVEEALPAATATATKKRA